MEPPNRGDGRPPLTDPQLISRKGELNPRGYEPLCTLSPILTIVPFRNFAQIKISPPLLAATEADPIQQAKGSQSSAKIASDRPRWAGPAEPRFLRTFSAQHTPVAPRLLGAPHTRGKLSMQSRG